MIEALLLTIDNCLCLTVGQLSIGLSRTSLADIKVRPRFFFRKLSIETRRTKTKQD